jgi:uncharacterized radical SAM protein YgiQ
MVFLPMNIKEVKARGWDEVDFVYVMGDSYVDHPSFGAAIITRVLEDCGYKVAVLSQPDWKNDTDFLQFGKPRLGFFVTAGNIDSMVAHYTVAKRKRSDDAYTAGGKNGKRPDRAVTVYSNIIRRLYPDSVIIIVKKRLCLVNNALFTSYRYRSSLMKRKRTEITSAKATTVMSN